MVTRAQLQSIEWAGWMPDGWEDTAQACPACDGLRPGQDLATHRTAEDNQVGHAPDCWLAAALAAPPQAPPEPQAMPPIETGDWVLTTGYPGGMAAAILAGRGLPVGRLQSYADSGEVLEIRKANGTVWTREPRR